MTFIVILGLYLVGMFAVGVYGSRYAKDTNSFLTSSKRGTLAIVTASYMASHFGAGFVVGGAEQGAQIGIGGIWFGFAMALSYVVFGLVMARGIYRAGYITVADLLYKTYGDRVTSTGYAIFNSIASVGIIAGQIMAGQRLLQAVGLDGFTGAAIVTIVVIVYSAMSGLWGVMMTDFIQMIVGGVGLLSVFFVVLSAGGFGYLQTALPANFFSVVPESWSTYQFLMILVPTTLYGFLSQASFQRVVASKDERVAVVSPFLSAALLIPLACLPPIIGMYGHAVFPDLQAGSVLFNVILNGLNPIFGALFIAAIIAAIMSTADSQILGVTANIVHDIYQNTLNPNASEKSCRYLSLVVAVATGAVSMFVALSFTTIIGLLSFTYSILVAGMLVPVLGGYLWKGATGQGATAAMITGVVVLFLGRYEILPVPYPQLVAAIPALVVLVAVSLVTGKAKA
ncbi:MAG: sodium:solute symporter family protein [Synergistaceae bacterium]|jgi:SSS family solute:Na+ symporter|nr:sodium:solute symporter family protein [Synergistaceae bacterium]